MICPKCNSQNVFIQREQSFSVGGSRTTYSHGHGPLYWLLIGWWIWIFKMMLAICTLGLSLLFRKKKGTANTVSTNKVFNKTVAVCQNCGFHWKV